MPPERSNSFSTPYFSSRRSMSSFVALRGSSPAKGLTRFWSRSIDSSHICPTFSSRVILRRRFSICLSIFSSRGIEGAAIATAELSRDATAQHNNNFVFIALTFVFGCYKIGFVASPHRGSAYIPSPPFAPTPPPADSGCRRIRGSDHRPQRRPEIASVYRLSRSSVCAGASMSPVEAVEPSTSMFILRRMSSDEAPTRSS